MKPLLAIPLLIIGTLTSLLAIITVALLAAVVGKVEL